jgi:TolB-like protein
MSNAPEIDRLLDGNSADLDQIVHIHDSNDSIPRPANGPQGEGAGLFHFLAELRRRRVCRAATMYSVVFWLVCQIVETIAPELGLPEWTVRLVIVLGLVGLPFVLIVSWLVDITSDGVVVDHGKESTSLRAPQHGLLIYSIDCALLIAAFAIGIQLATGIMSSGADATQPVLPKITVLPFNLASGNDTGAFAAGLAAEIQYQLAINAGVTVIASEDPYQTSNCISLAGAVAIGDRQVRITAWITDKETGAITWSRVFVRGRSDALSTPVDLAHEIVAALPLALEQSDRKDANDVG